MGKDINGWAVGSAFGNRTFYRGNRLLRAAAALAGIYTNDAAEVVYPMAKADAAGQPLDGSKHNCTLTFAAGPYPPVNAFWLTMYDSKTQLLIENPINRYLLRSDTRERSRETGVSKNTAKRAQRGQRLQKSPARQDLEGHQKPFNGIF